MIFSFWEARRPPFLHRGHTKAHISGNWRRQTTNSPANRDTKSTSVPPLGSVFGPLLVTFSIFYELCDFVKIELPSWREVNSEGPGPLKM